MIAFFRRRRRRPDAVVCRDAVALMAGYLDDALASRDRSRLEGHLAACPHCSEHLAQLQVTIEALGRVDVVDALPDAAVDDLVAVYRRWLAD